MTSNRVWSHSSAVWMLVMWLMCSLTAQASWTVKPSDNNTPGSINRGKGSLSFTASSQKYFDANIPSNAQSRFWFMDIQSSGAQTWGVGDIRINRFGTGITDVIRFTEAYIPDQLPANRKPSSKPAASPSRTQHGLGGAGSREEPIVYVPAQNDTVEENGLPYRMPPRITTLGESPPAAAGLTFTVTFASGFFWYTYRANSANKYLPFQNPAGIPVPPGINWPVVTLGPGVTSYKPTSIAQPGFINGQGDINFDFSLSPNQCSQSNGGCDSSPFGTCTCSGTGCSVPVCGCSPVAASSGFPPYMVGPWNGLQGSVCVGYQFPCNSNAGCHPTPQLYCSIIAGNIGLCRVDKCLETVCGAGKTCLRAGDSAQCV